MAKMQCNIISYVLGRAVDITVIIPTLTIPVAMGWSNEGKPSHVIKEKYPVLYLLHGFGNNHATWCGYSNIELFAEEWNIAVVMISGENRYYRDIPGVDDFYRFVEEELPEFVTNMFPVSDKPENTYIAGASMGGAGALMHGLGNPEKYRAVGAFSAALSDDGRGERLDPDRPDPRPVVEQMLKEKRKMPSLYLACGKEDFLYQESLSFQEFLQEKRVDVTWVCVPDFGHEWRFWDQQVEAFLDWLPRTDEYAKKGKRKI